MIMDLQQSVWPSVHNKTVPHIKKNNTRRTSCNFKDLLQDERLIPLWACDTIEKQQTHLRRLLCVFVVTMASFLMWHLINYGWMNFYCCLCALESSDGNQESKTRLICPLGAKSAAPPAVKTQDFDDWWKKLAKQNDLSVCVCMRTRARAYVYVCV